MGLLEARTPISTTLMIVHTNGFFNMLRQLYTMAVLEPPPAVSRMVNRLQLCLSSESEFHAAKLDEVSSETDANAVLFLF